MINVLNNLPKDYDVVLNGLQNCLMATGDHAMTIYVICKKFNHGYERNKSKKEEKTRKNRP